MTYYMVFKELRRTTREPSYYKRSRVHVDFVRCITI